MMFKASYKTISAIMLVSVLIGCSDFFFSAPVFDNPYDPQNSNSVFTVPFRAVAIGESNAWAGLIPAIVDPAGDAAIATDGVDITAVYLAQDSQFFYWRMDLADDAPSTDGWAYMLWVAEDESKYLDRMEAAISPGSDAFSVIQFYQNSSVLNADFPADYGHVASYIEMKLPLDLVQFDEFAVRAHVNQYNGDIDPDYTMWRSVRISRDADNPSSGLASVVFREMALAPPGSFTQQESGGGGVFDHTVSEFLIAHYPVTYELWHAVYEWAILRGYNFASAGREGSAGAIGQEPSSTSARFEPVTGIAWRDAIVWANAYSEIEGLRPIYYQDVSFTIPIRNATDIAAVRTFPGSIDNPYVDWSASGYRLPTEGEWQFAGSFDDGESWTPSNFPSGSTADYLNETANNEVAWYTFNSGGTTHVVGSKLSNNLSLFDMSGNVYEWCWDWDGAYPTDPVDPDYRGPENGTDRIIRGGSWSRGAISLQTGARDYMVPWDGQDEIGFRVVRNP